MKVEGSEERLKVAGVRILDANGDESVRNCKQSWKGNWENIGRNLKCSGFLTVYFLDPFKFFENPLKLLPHISSRPFQLASFLVFFSKLQTVYLQFTESLLPIL